jgi:hypothetical protein
MGDNITTICELLRSLDMSQLYPQPVIGTASRVPGVSNFGWGASPLAVLNSSSCARNGRDKFANGRSAFLAIRLASSNLGSNSRRGTTRCKRAQKGVILSIYRLDFDCISKRYISSTAQIVQIQVVEAHLCFL